MIRHAGPRATLPILALPVEMIQPSLRALLVPAVGAAPLFNSRLVATGNAAITMSTIAVRAEKEHRAAFSTQANSKTENRLAVNRHQCALAALDNGNDFVAP